MRLAGTDLVIPNARVRTMDPHQPPAEGIAVPGNRVAAAGSNAGILKQARISRGSRLPGLPE